MVACSVKVIHGANDGLFEVAGSTVRCLRDSLVDAFNIPDDAIALANGQRVPGCYEVRGNDVLEFVRERGEKGGKKAATAAPADDGGDDADKDEAPDYSTMDLDALAYCIRQRFSRSEQASRFSALQAHKSAVHLFWAGSALSRAKDLCEQEGHGKWKSWKAEQGLADTTVNDAIRLFKGAKTPEALTGLGVTEAKQKFVYPVKEEPEEKPKVKNPKPTNTKGASGPGKPPGRKNPKPANGHNDAPQQPAPEDGGDVINATDPADAVAEELEDIAQQLNAIAQDDLGKVDFTGQIPTRLTTAVLAVAKGLAKIHERINHDRSHS